MFETITHSQMVKFDELLKEFIKSGGSYSYTLKNRIIFSDYSIWKFWYGSQEIKVRGDALVDPAIHSLVCKWLRSFIK